MAEEKIYETTTNVSSISRDRPKSLRTAIPMIIREMLDLTKDDKILWGIYQENGKKYAKIYKK